METKVEKNLNINKNYEIMKTYKKVIEKKSLEISYDNGSYNPREWNNIGFFTTVDSRYNSPDERYKNIVESTGDKATSLENHIELIKKEIEDVIFIVPISKYEHGGVAYSVGQAFGFDYGNNGFYIVTKESYKEVMGDTVFDEKRALEIIEYEINTYNQWVNGEVYSFTLYNDEGEVEDSCSGIYDIESVKEHLGEDWKDEDMNDYLKH